MSDFWGILVPTLVGKSFYTLGRGHEFRVEEMGEGHLLIVTTQGRRRIPRRELEGAWQNLTRQGKLTQQQIVKGSSPFNSAYVAALLAQMQGVGHTSNPITLSYRKGGR